ncbi:MAG: PrpF domain-containing protein [Thermoanaerobacteraceae bacterium]|nr:PrpF domain-containing protein [Thermoanaerobacteraceae bacterium]
MQYKIKSVLMRGGTSRALFFKREDLPDDPELQKKIFISAIGTPDPKQIDGVGGTTSSTSKIAIIEKSTRPGIDIDYTFVQVGVTEPIIDINGNCGNISSAVGPYAVDEGLVIAKEPYTEVKIYNTNTNKLFTSSFKVKNGRFAPEGNFSIPGLIQNGSEIRLTFYNPEGSITGKIFPTDKTIDRIVVERKEYQITLIDITNPYIFMDMGNIGFNGIESTDFIDGSSGLKVLQLIRDSVSERIGLNSKAFPKIMMIKKNEEKSEIITRTISMGKTHKTIPLTGAMCLAAATGIPGTLPNMIAGIEFTEGYKEFNIGYPGGTTKIGVEFAYDNNNYTIKSITCSRTARRIMEGFVYATI